MCLSRSSDSDSPSTDFNSQRSGVLVGQQLRDRQITDQHLWAKTAYVGLAAGR